MSAWVKRILLLALLIAAGYFAWTWLFPNPQKVIRKQFKEIAQLATFNVNEAPLAKLANTQKLLSYFAANVEAVVDVPGRSRQFTISGREDLSQAAMAIRSQIPSLTVDFPDVAVTVAPDRENATADTTLRANVGSEKDSYIQEVKFTLRLTSGRWLITRLETVKTLQ